MPGVERKINVLHVVERNPYGGIFRVINDILGTLHQRVSFHAAVVDDPSYKGEFSFGGLPIPMTEIKGGTIAKWRQLRRLAEGYDIVHLHGFSPWQASALLGTRGKLLFTNHGLLGVGRKLRPHEKLKRNLMKLFLRRRVDRIANISEYARRRIIREYGVSPSRNSVVFNCTRWPATPPRVQVGNGFRLGFHGRFVHFKRIDRMLEVAARLSSSIDLRVQLLGDGPMKETMRDKGEKLGLSVEFIPYQLDIQGIVRLFDVEIIPSDEEYFGLSVLESIQAGHPTFVFSDGGGCVEIFDEESGWFVCDGIDQMAERIASLSQPEIAAIALEKLGHLQERVSRRFSARTLGEGYFRIYSELASGQGRYAGEPDRQPERVEQIS
jgi:glycosyltransferase involved in cell wall biosynthesis